jgi:3-phosphoshikimate 1-carboxyvinyltransferase
MDYRIKPSKLFGQVEIPTSKSHTLRAILFASFAEGQSRIHHYLKSPDTVAMINACVALGAKISVYPKYLEVIGHAGRLQTPIQPIDAGNSGQVLRFIGAVAALHDMPIEIIGDASICQNRPVMPLLSALASLNCQAISKFNNGFAPIIIKGPHLGGHVSMDGMDSQPVSGLLIASAFAPNATTIEVNRPGELPWIELTLDWFRRLGISYEHEDYKRFFIPGHSRVKAFEYTVPGDFSSAAFPLLASLVTQSPLTLKSLDMQDIQGDKMVFEWVEKMGVKLKCRKHLSIYPSPNLQGMHCNVNSMIDSIPFWAVFACFLKTPTLLMGAEIAKFKESNRLYAMSHELRKMGASIQETQDGLEIHPSKLKGASVYSHQDHRVAMALSIAGLGADGETIVQDVDCIDKSYPGFLKSMQAIGAQIE